MSKRLAIDRALVPSVTISLPVGREDGKFKEADFELICDWNFLSAVEELTGKNLLNKAQAKALIGEKISDTEFRLNLNARTASILLWAALQDYELSLREVRRMILPWNLETIITKIGEAITLGMPEEKEPADPPQPAPTT